MKTCEPSKPLTARQLLNRQRGKESAAYGGGCQAGHQLALQWRMDPHRGDLARGGALQHYLLDLAEALVRAGDGEQTSRARGALVGFAIALESPDFAEVAAVATCLVLGRAMASARGLK